MTFLLHPIVIAHSSPPWLSLRIKGSVMGEKMALSPFAFAAAGHSQRRTGGLAGPFPWQRRAGVRARPRRRRTTGPAAGTWPPRATLSPCTANKGDGEMVTTVGTESNLVDTLNNLIELDYDAIEAYDAAIDRLDSAEYKARLKEFRDDHARHTRDLAAAVKELGGKPAQQGGAKSLLTRGKVMMADLLGRRRHPPGDEVQRGRHQHRLRAGGEGRRGHSGGRGRPAVGPRGRTAPPRLDRAGALRPLTPVRCRLHPAARARGAPARPAPLGGNVCSTRGPHPPAAAILPAGGRLPLQMPETSARAGHRIATAVRGALARPGREQPQYERNRSRWGRTVRGPSRGHDVTGRVLLACLTSVLSRPAPHFSRHTRQRL